MKSYQYMFFKKKLFSKKKIAVWTLVVLCVVTITYIIMEGKITVSPLVERDRIMRLEEIKKRETLAPFVSDGCSGNISKAWSGAVAGLSGVFADIDRRYFDIKNIPFEYACEKHDWLYHKGEGGYVGRLRADNELRQEIINYALEHVDDIKRRTRLQTDESAIFLYETIADLVYRGVRLGGAPCSGESYAWGYGYGGGVCK